MQFLAVPPLLLTLPLASNPNTNPEQLPPCARAASQEVQEETVQFLDQMRRKEEEAEAKTRELSATKRHLQELVERLQAAIIEDELSGPHVRATQTVATAVSAAGCQAMICSETELGQCYQRRWQHGCHYAVSYALSTSL